MSTSIFIKVFSDCCLCVAFVRLVAIPHASNAPFLAAMLLCALAASIASVLLGKNKITLSRLCCLLPLLSLLIAGDISQLFTMLVPILYTGIVILRGVLYLEYYSYRQYVIITSILLLIVFFFGYIAAPLVNFMHGGEIVDIYAFLGFGSIHVISGFYLLRRLRIGSDRVTRMIFRPFTVIAASSVVLSAVYWAMDTCFSKLMRAVESVTDLAFKASKRLFINLALDSAKEKTENDRPSQLPSSSPTTPDTSKVPSDTGIVPPDTANTIPEQLEPKDDYGGIDLDLPELDAGTILIVILVLVVLAVLVLMVLSFRARSREVTEWEAVAPLEGSGRKSTKTPILSNRARVRQLYRIFLRQEIRRGMILHPSDTSEDILRKLRQDADQESAAALRKIYIQARYDESHPVSHEQVENAREALKNLQDDK